MARGSISPRTIIDRRTYRGRGTAAHTPPIGPTSITPRAAVGRGSNVGPGSKLIILGCLRYREAKLES